MMTFNPKFFLSPAARLCTALLAAAASSAVCATSVSIGGMYDTGLKYTFVNDGIHGTETALGMESSMLDSSRFAIRAHEDISDQLSVGFIAESGFRADSGQLQEQDIFFNLGSLFYLSHKQYGELWMGRLGTMRSGATRGLPDPRSAHQPVRLRLGRLRRRGFVRHALHRLLGRQCIAL